MLVKTRVYRWARSCNSFPVSLPYFAFKVKLRVKPKVNIKTKRGREAYVKHSKTCYRKRPMRQEHHRMSVYYDSWWDGMAGVERLSCKHVNRSRFNMVSKDYHRICLPEYNPFQLYN